MFYGTVGAVFLHFSGANAADMLAKAPLADQPQALGAVDGFSAKADVFGGTYMNREFFGSKASASAPLGDRLSPYGVQIDGAKGRFDNRSFGAIGGHLFWRDPSQGLLGLYASYTNWNQFGGIHVGQVAAEGAAYWGRWTVEGIAGVEFGNRTSVISGDTINGFLVQSIDVQTRFFDKINFAYYLLDDLKVYVGHRYLGGRNAAAFGTEWAVPLKSNGVQAALFAEARVGEGDFHGIWGGVKVYFGQKDKSLMQRHRQDDPFEWTPESLSTLAAVVNQIIPGTPLPPPCTGDGCG